MKVMIISASPNQIGLTNLCVETSIKILEKESISYEWVCLNKFNIKKCEACGERGWGICLEEHICRIEDDFNTLQLKMESYDAFIIVSPVYFYEMSEAAKTFFDRLKRCQSFKKDSGLKGKKVIFVACAGGSGDGTENTLNAMKILAKFLHMKVEKEIGVTKKNFEEKRVEIQDATYEIIV